jgi:hypothetical protein
VSGDLTLPSKWGCDKNPLNHSNDEQLEKIKQTMMIKTFENKGVGHFKIPK